MEHGDFDACLPSEATVCMKIEFVHEIPIDLIHAPSKTTKKKITKLKK